MKQKEATILQLQYGVNVYADGAYNAYRPLAMTAQYPDPEATVLRHTLALYVGCTPDMILCGNGSDELIDLYIRAYRLKKTDMAIAIAPPTYYQYANYAKRIGVRIILLPEDRREISAASLERAGGNPGNTFVMLDSPANPSGEIVARQQFIQLLKAGYNVFADEAYYEFCGKTVVDLVAQYPEQLVVSRSFSKIAAMAGSRIGYVVASPACIETLHEHKMLFNVGSESQHRALYALEHMDKFLAAVQDMRMAKHRIGERIWDLGAYSIYPSLDMYLIFSHSRVMAGELQAKLRAEHLIETYLFPRFKKGVDVLRAAVLDENTMQRLVFALAAYV